jgi:glycosyltransferase involved in cell wall biosynthesis
MSGPLRVSVVIPLYNKASFVEQAVRSVLAQGYPVCEVIVVDDGSTDDGPARVASITDVRLTLLTQPNRGVSAARNRGIQHATGDLVAFLDGDDLFHPTFIGAIAGLVEEYPQAGMAATGYARLLPDGSRVVLPVHRSVRKRGLIDDFYLAWGTSAFFCSGSIAIRRSLFETHSDLRFPVGEPLGEDQDLWFRVAERTRIAFDPAVHADYRVNLEGSATGRTRVLQPLRCYLRLSQRLAAGGVPPQLCASASRLFGSHLINVARERFDNGDTAGADELLQDRRSRANWPYWARTKLQLAARGLTRRIRT